MKQATKKHSKTPNRAQLAEFGGRVAGILEELDGAKKADAAAQLARREREEAERTAPVTVPRERYNAAMEALAGINASAFASYQLSISAVCASDDREAHAYMTAVENAAILTARRCDVISELLQGGSFGCFLDDVDAEHAADAARRRLEDAQ